MKKILLFAMSGMLFMSCSKDVKSPSDSQDQELSVMNAAAAGRGESRETAGQKAIKANGVVVFNKETNEGTYGWVIKVNEFEYIVPDFLPKQFQAENSMVTVVYEFTDRQIVCSCEQPKYVAHIIDIQTRYESQ